MATALAASPLTAQELRVATSYKLMTLDPQFADLNENTSLLSHIYERLVYQDEKLNPKPGLAVSWKRLSDTKWSFSLRENVQFHDGSPFTAEDVVYSLERVRSFLKPPSGGFQSYTQAIKSVTAQDPLTVIIETNASAPTLPLALSSIFIMPHLQSGFRSTEDLNGGKVTPIGTGPYKFDSWQSGERLKLVRNDSYWGGKPAWSQVEFRVIESPAARVAALSTGDVDLADYIPARDVESLKTHGLSVASTPAARSNFVQFDLEKNTLPDVTNSAGEPIPNPFKNKQVREALTMATDRPLLADKILLGYGTAAAQLFPNGLPGTSAKLVATPPDYDKAKELLAQAGYPEGFNVVVAGPTGRYPGDGESLQAITQNWARIGVRVQPVVAPFSTFATKRSAGEYSVWYGGCSGDSVSVCLDAVLASPNAERKTGSLNYGHYRNPVFDEALAKAQEIDEGPERDAAMATATELVMADDPIVPLYHFHLIAGYGKHVASYTVHARGWTTAMQAVPAGE
nr:ABC transporter substrate-binding protein [Agrobacterium larrymoorei]